MVPELVIPKLARPLFSASGIQGLVDDPPETSSFGHTLGPFVWVLGATFYIFIYLILH